jgi:hypothetical protein
LDATTAGMVSDRESGGTHTSRTIQLEELRGLLAAAPVDAEAAAYRDAIVEQNALGKKTLNSRQRTHRYLRELYALDPDVLLFRALRDLWDADVEAQPLLAMLSSLARDPSLRATASAVLPLAAGAPVTSLDLQLALQARYPGSYGDAVANKVGRNAASSWTQSGHLAGRTGKTRAQAVCRPPAVAYALLLGHLEGAAGEGLFESFWARVLNAPLGVLHDQAFAASQRGWIEFRLGGGVTDVGFSLLLREPIGVDER